MVSSGLRDIFAYLTKNKLVDVIITSVGLGFALAFGLGMREAISDVSQRYFKKVKV